MLNQVQMMDCKAFQNYQTSPSVDDFARGQGS